MVRQRMNSMQNLEIHSKVAATIGTGEIKNLQYHTSWQESVCKTNAFLVVHHLGNEESVKHVLIVVFVRKLMKEILAFYLLCKFFCELAKHRHTNAYETLHRHSWVSV